MKNNFLFQLSSLGRVILFGSLSENPKRIANDVDLLLVVPNNKLEEIFAFLTNLVEDHNLTDQTYIQKLFSYDKNLNNKFIHLLVCEENDLLSNHPIISSVKRGINLGSNYAT